MDAALTIHEMRSLLECIHFVRRTAVQTAVDVITIGVSKWRVSQVHRVTMGGELNAAVRDAVAPEVAETESWRVDILLDDLAVDGEIGIAWSTTCPEADAAYLSGIDLPRLHRVEQRRPEAPGFLWARNRRLRRSALRLF
jgi:hypothetical protein